MNITRCDVCMETFLGSRIRAGGGSRLPLSLVPVCLCIFPLVPMFLPGICLLPRLRPLTPSARKELATSTRSAPQSSAPAGGPSVNSCTCCNVPAVGTCASSQSAPTPRGAAVSKISTSKAQHKSNTFLGREGMSVSDES